MNEYHMSMYEYIHVLFLFLFQFWGVVPSFRKVGSRHKHIGWMFYIVDGWELRSYTTISLSPNSIYLIRHWIKEFNYSKELKILNEKEWWWGMCDRSSFKYAISNQSANSFKHEVFFLSSFFGGRGDEAHMCLEWDVCVLTHMLRNIVLYCLLNKTIPHSNN